MDALPSPADAKTWCEQRRVQGKRIGFVPTMGALHEGHLSLVRNARAENHLVCASIFVNPLQFNNPQDLASYPRDPEADSLAFEQAGCDMVFTGSLEGFFPEVASLEDIPTRHAGRFGVGLEGDHRPGHLDGVATIVERLFRTVGQCTAYFGEKDYQQTLVVRDLANDLADQGLHILVRVCETIRDPGGLALSSRNQRLSPDQLITARKLHRALQAAKAAWQDGIRSPESLELAMTEILNDPDITVEYARVLDEDNWSQTVNELTTPRGFVAATIGSVRLIDNLSMVE